MKKSKEKYRVVPWEKRWTIEHLVKDRWLQVYVGPVKTCVEELKALEKEGAEVEFPREK